ncbi:DNA-protecting protein DprA [Microcoleus sp. LEGE 07076]|uniref:DNA-processing protein DprA n=1 Tax=Microcoleus sp. LEGE 07076 TaxID=915322 RepID=UPI00187E32E7|nr:DNA-processing protein DprA [Microcoleus sp. LEGE 07076]MBE9185208.1 DNA-protecting protein DprA [Microcoleus sp. LEGE 07076]
MLEERAYWLAWSQIGGIGPTLLQRLQQNFPSLAAAWTAKPVDLMRVEGFGKQTIETVLQQRAKLNPEEFIEKHLIKNPCFWTPADKDYPSLLLEIPNPPPVLYYRGLVDLKENCGITPTVAIVGTRSPSEYGRRWTRKFSAALATNGFTVVSGFAAGIDTEAHTSCLDAGGRTLAVFGTGVDVVYPKPNERLCDRLLQQGLAISEYPAGTQPNRTNFPRRNRIIAGLSRATIVIEAPHKSGALITAYQANDFCRDVYVLTARLDDERSFGCLELLSKGAHPILPNSDRLLSEDRLLEMLGAMPKLDRAEQLSLFPANPTVEKRTPPLEPELAVVLSAIDSGTISFDTIVEVSKLEGGTVSGILLQLELLGLVSQLPGMRYQRC